MGSKNMESQVENESPDDVLNKMRKLEEFWQKFEKVLFSRDFTPLPREELYDR